MKKIILSIAVFAGICSASAQVKSINAATSSLEAAITASTNPKKCDKADTWVKLGKAYMDAYASPLGDGWKGAAKQELAILMGGVKPKSVETVELAGALYEKNTYDAFNYYFDANGILCIMEATKKVCDNPLEEAIKAFNKAYELETKDNKKADIKAAVKDAVSKLEDEAFAAYTLGNMELSASFFEKAAQNSLTPASPNVDTIAFYNAGFLSQSAGNNAKAKEYFIYCLEKLNYIGTEGDVYGRLAAIFESEGDTDSQKKYLEEGFAAYPQSQYILIGLINFYMTRQDSADRLFELVAKAKENEPNNASLWYVEGNVYKELGKLDEAIASYRKCFEINPEYEYGFVGEGILYYNEALNIQDKAQAELDDAKYMALVAEFEKALKSCIEPFEKAFEVTKDDSLKVNISEYLKNACFRFRDESPELASKYEKYNAIVANGTAK